jgi:hypothetical protein
MKVQRENEKQKVPDLTFDCHLYADQVILATYLHIPIAECIDI